MLEVYRDELQQELLRILQYWSGRMVDEVHGGFFGQIDNNNNIHTEAPRGSVLNMRILWSFSAAYRASGNSEFLCLAERAYHYNSKYFIDNTFGGVYWLIDYQGKPLDTKKQVYAQAFAVYALSEYFLASKDAGALNLAREIYALICTKAYDPIYGGYTEAFSRNWQELADWRLSEKDANEKKTANTHLHILEAFTALYRAWPHEALRRRVEDLLQLFLTHIVDRCTHHLQLFFSESWAPRSKLVSFGHDIEASWLLYQAAKATADPSLINSTKQIAVQMSEAAMTATDTDGGIWYEYDADNDHWIKEKHWWPQAEGMVGFFNAWEISGNEKYLQSSLRCWHFVQEHLLDKKQGEWYWGVHENNRVMQERDKAGFWKCPYHNSRACMEIIGRIQRLK